jgi:hypothetical protein
VLVPESEPTDGNTGWHVSTSNLGTPSAYALTVTAQCLAGGAITSVSATSASNGAEKDVTASCAAGAVVTGGGYSLGGS